MKDLRVIISEFFEKEGIDASGVFHLAFSGGSDSLSLLHALTEVINGSLDAVYVDHALRDRKLLDEEIALNRRNCERLNVPLRIHTLEDGEVEALCREKKITTEAAARELRYRHFDTLDGYVITAHNLDDQAESIFMRLLSGSTFQSLSGIRRVRGKYLRPLLSVSKGEIEEYARHYGLIWSQDHTNSELFCLRNRVRHLVMPYLGDEVRNRLSRIADNVAAFTKASGMCRLNEHGLYVSLSRKELLEATEIRRSITLLTVLSRHTERRVSRGELAEIVRAAERKTTYSGREYVVTVTIDEVRFYPQKYWFSARFTSSFRSGGFAAVRSDAMMALCLKCDGSLIIRMDEDGDVLRTKGGTVKVSKLLSSMCVPYAPVVCDREKPVAVFASCLGGVNRISSDLMTSDWMEKPRMDVIWSPLT